MSLICLKKSPVSPLLSLSAVLDKRLCFKYFTLTAICRWPVSISMGRATHVAGRQAGAVQTQADYHCAAEASSEG